MSTRKLVGVVILVAWAGAMAWYAKRLYLQPEAERLAEAARSIPPGIAYYAIYQEGQRAGWAQSEIDTLPSNAGFLVNDRLVLRLSGFGLPGRATVRSEARLGSALGLERFHLDAEGVLGGVSADGEVEGDSVLSLTVRRPGDTLRRRIPVDGRVVLATALPLRLAAGGAGTPGERIRVATFDPMQMASRSVEVEVLDRRVHTFPDSADRDTVAGVWRELRRDTVLAWKIARAVGRDRVVAWIDEDGRFVQLETPGGLRMERTAFELAYFGFRGDSVEAFGPRPLHPRRSEADGADGGADGDRGDRGDRGRR